MICPGCSATLLDDARFCIHCGTQMSQPAAMSGYPQGYPYSFGCTVCGGDGSLLPAAKVYCAGCRWLRPLAPDYEIPIDAFMWRLDADAMNLLHSLGPLTAIARTISERVGRPWFEASVNGLRLSERQMPEIFNTAIKAARIMSLPYLPEIYISGDQMWDAATLGTDNSAFIVIGSVLINFKEDDLLFVLGREMGHARAGHALWKTVMQFVSGKGHHRSIMGEGMLKMLNPAKIVESAIDAPLMAWARHSEITADSAGLLCIGKEAVARKVLQTWTFRSFPLLTRMNQEAWMEQENAAEEVTTQVAEWTLSSAPYIAGRLRLMREFANSETLAAWRQVIDYYAPATPSAPAGTAPGGGAAPPPIDPNSTRLICPSCKEAMRVPNSVLAGTEAVNIRCPNAKCRAVLTVKPKAAAPPPPTEKAPEPASPKESDEPAPETMVPQG